MRKTAVLFARCSPALRGAVQQLAKETDAPESYIVRRLVLSELRRRRRWPPKKEPEVDAA